MFRFQAAWNPNIAGSFEESPASRYSRYPLQ